MQHCSSWLVFYFILLNEQAQLIYSINIRLQLGDSCLVHQNFNRHCYNSKSLQEHKGVVSLLFFICPANHIAFGQTLNRECLNQRMF